MWTDVRNGRTDAAKTLSLPTLSGDKKTEVLTIVCGKDEPSLYDNLDTSVVMSLVVTSILEGTDLKQINIGTTTVISMAEG